jgi:hypothetical protein
MGFVNDLGVLADRRTRCGTGRPGSPLFFMRIGNSLHASIVTTFTVAP